MLHYGGITFGQRGVGNQNQRDRPSWKDRLSLANRLSPFSDRTAEDQSVDGVAETGQRPSHGSGGTDPEGTPSTPLTLATPHNYSRLERLVFFLTRKDPDLTHDPDVRLGVETYESAKRMSYILANAAPFWEGHNRMEAR